MHSHRRLLSPQGKDTNKVLTLQDCQFHVAWNQARKTARDLVDQFGLEAFSPQDLSILGEIYLHFSRGSTAELALDRARQCLSNCKARGVDPAQESLEWVLSLA